MDDASKDCWKQGVLSPVYSTAVPYSRRPTEAASRPSSRGTRFRINR